jgi:hypothetical protein
MNRNKKKCTTVTRNNRRIRILKKNARHTTTLESLLEMNRKDEILRRIIKHTNNYYSKLSPYVKEVRRRASRPYNETIVEAIFLMHHYNGDFCFVNSQLDGFMFSTNPNCPTGWIRVHNAPTFRG